MANRIADTHFATYLKDRQGASLLESESGFVSYKVVNGECFICDIFVVKEKRGSGALGELINTLKDVAIFEGAECLSGTIYMNDTRATKTIASAIRVGFQVVRAEAGIILIAMKLGGE